MTFCKASKRRPMEIGRASIQVLESQDPRFTDEGPKECEFRLESRRNQWCLRVWSMRSSCNEHVNSGERIHHLGILEDASQPAANEDRRINSETDIIRMPSTMTLAGSDFWNRGTLKDSCHEVLEVVPTQKRDLPGHDVIHASCKELVIEFEMVEVEFLICLCTARTGGLHSGCCGRSMDLCDPKQNSHI